MRRKRIIAIGIPIFLVLGLITGLGKTGVFDLPFSYYHGVLMLNGFAGGIITVERFLTKKDSWTFIGLVALVFGTGLYVIGMEEGLILVAINIGIILLMEAFSVKRESFHYDIYQVMGFFSWFLANLKFYLGEFYPAAVPSWKLFILLMIISTRLKKIGKNDFISLVLALLVFSSLWIDFHGLGQLIYGIGLIGLGIRMGYLELKQPKNVLFSLFLAYAWLVVSGLALIFSSLILYSYDLAIHAFLLGFLFSMIFLNAQQAFLKKFGSNEVKTHPNLWTSLLSVGLIVRLIGGDLMEMQQAQMIGGVMNFLTILGFVLSILVQVIRVRLSARELQ